MDARSSPTARSADALQLHALETAFAQRESWAFEAAYDAYRRLLYGAAYAVLRDAGASEDCVHDVLMRLWRAPHAYTPERGSLQAFLAVCVRNEALSRRRRSGNRDRIERAQLRLVETAPPPDDAATAHVDLDRALQHLGEAPREAVRLAYYEGLTYEQVAQRVGEPLGTVKSRLSNALRAMRAFMQQGENQ